MVGCSVIEISHIKKNADGEKIEYTKTKDSYYVKNVTISAVRNPSNMSYTSFKFHGILVMNDVDLVQKIEEDDYFMFGGKKYRVDFKPCIENPTDQPMCQRMVLEGTC